MLYNPHTKVPSLESFTAWLEAQDPDATYDWGYVRECACGAYARSRGCFREWRKAWKAINNYFYDDDAPPLTEDQRVWSSLNNVAKMPTEDKWGERRYGDLLKMVRFIS